MWQNLGSIDNYRGVVFTAVIAYPVFNVASYPLPLIFDLYNNYRRVVFESGIKAYRRNDLYSAAMAAEIARKKFCGAD